MPESVTDRPTKAHSTIFLLSKQPRYFWDADAIREPADPGSIAREGRARLTAYDAPGQTPQRRTPSNGDWTNSGANARSVWTIPTQPTPFAHFATWPQKLVARMIQAGTSEKGCCPECGAAWVRDVDTTYERPATGGGKQPTHNPQRGAMPLRVSKVVETLGWSPSCLKSRCKTGRPPIPCTVLDPFAGSGTTLLVARQHGRHSIGIELNADYCHIAAKRLQQLSLLT